MKIKMKPTSVIIAHLGLEENGKVQSFFTNTCAKHMDKYVPRRDGFLRQYKIDGNYIIYGDGPSNPYAKVQYYGMRKDGTYAIKNYTTPGTGPYWDKRMVSAEMNTVLQEVQNYMKVKG